MKICICSPISLELLKARCDDPSGLQGGYLYPFAAYLAQAYWKLGHEVTVVTNSAQSRSKNFWEGDRFKVYNTFRRPHFTYCLDFYKREVQAMAECILQAKPDVIHAQWSYEFADASIRSNIPTLVTCRDSPGEIARQLKTPYRIFRYFYSKQVISRAKHISCISPYLQNEIQRFGKLSSPPHLIPNAIDDQLFTSKAKISQPVTANFVTVSGPDRRKNIESTLKAFSFVIQSVPKATLHIFGKDLSSNSNAGQLAKSLQIDGNVVFYGYRSHAEIISYLSSFDGVFVHSSLEESFGMTLLEAQASGLPVVAGRNSGAVPWVLDQGRAGILVDVSDPHSIAEGMLRAVSSADTKEIQNYAWQRAHEEFSLSAVAKKYTDLLSQACLH